MSNVFLMEIYVTHVYVAFTYDLPSFYRCINVCVAKFTLEQSFNLSHEFLWNGKVTQRLQIEIQNVQIIACDGNKT